MRENILEATRRAVELGKSPTVETLEADFLKGFGKQSTNEAKDPPRIAKFRKIVKTKSFGKVDGTPVDLFSASAVTQVYDALSKPANQKKYAKMDPVEMISIAYKLLQKGRRAATSRETSQAGAGVKNAMAQAVVGRGAPRKPLGDVGYGGTHEVAGTFVRVSFASAGKAHWGSIQGAAKDAGGSVVGGDDKTREFRFKDASKAKAFAKSMKQTGAKVFTEAQIRPPHSVEVFRTVIVGDNKAQQKEIVSKLRAAGKVGETMLRFKTLKPHGVIVYIQGRNATGVGNYLKGVLGKMAELGPAVGAIVRHVARGAAVGVAKKAMAKEQAKLKLFRKASGSQPDVYQVLNPSGGVEGFIEKQPDTRTEKYPWKAFGRTYGGKPGRGQHLGDFNNKNAAMKAVLKAGG